MAVWLVTGTSRGLGQGLVNARLATQRIIERVALGLPNDGLASRLILGSDAARLITGKLALLTAQIQASAAQAGSVDLAAAQP